MAKKVERWQCEDGVLFESENAALVWESRLRFNQRLHDEAWYRGISPSEVSKWLFENFEVIPKEDV